MAGFAGDWCRHTWSLFGDGVAWKWGHGPVIIQVPGESSGYLYILVLHSSSRPINRGPWYREEVSLQRAHRTAVTFMISILFFLECFNSQESFCLAQDKFEHVHGEQGSASHTHLLTSWAHLNGSCWKCAEHEGGRRAGRYTEKTTSIQFLLTKRSIFLAEKKNEWNESRFSRSTFRKNSYHSDDDKFGYFRRPSDGESWRRNLLVIKTTEGKKRDNR